MNIRDAILAAAAHIEANPQEFDFWSINTPAHPGCGVPGCALGWIGTFSGIGATPIDVAKEALGLFHRNGWDHAAVFYDRMREFKIPWNDNATECARALRLYIDKHHPATKPVQQAPNWNAMAAHQSVPESADGNAVSA